MYNRYIPQPDGSYRRSRVQDQARQPLRHRPTPPQCPPASQEPESCTQAPPPPPKKPKMHSHPREKESLTGFFRNLLPKDLDTSDLLIILLLLVMAGDREEDKNNALLTLALYFLL